MALETKYYSVALQTKISRLETIVLEMEVINQNIAKIDNKVAEKIASSIISVVSASTIGVPIVLPENVALLAFGIPGFAITIFKRIKLRPLLAKIQTLKAEYIKLNNEVNMEKALEDKKILDSKTIEPEGSENDDLIDVIGKFTGIRSATSPETSRNLVIGSIVGLGFVSYLIFKKKSKK